MKAGVDISKFRPAVDSLGVDNRVDILLVSSDQEERAIVPDLLVQRDGCRALPRLQTLLENDLAPQMREAAFHEIAKLLVTPIDPHDRAAVDFMRKGVHSGIEALQNGLLNERDSVALVSMSGVVVKLATDNPMIGERLADPLVERLRRDGVHSASSFKLCEALIPIIENSLDKAVIRKIADVGDTLMGQVRAEGDIRRSHYSDIRPLLTYLYAKKEEMGL